MPQGPLVPKMTTLILTLMTYNIRHGAGMDNTWDISRQVAAVRKVNPDVLCLQEVDRHTKRSFGADEPAMLAHLLAPLSNWEFVKSIDFQGGEYGNAILSAETPLGVRRIPLPEPHEPRSMVVCEYGAFSVCNTHLSLYGDCRMATLDVFRELARTAKKPVFFAGDWNSSPKSPFIRALAEDLVFLSDTNAPTCHAESPRTCIDYIAVDRRHAGMVKVLSAEVPDEPLASDHRPVVVKLELTIKDSE